MDFRDVIHERADLLLLDEDPVFVIPKFINAGFRQELGAAALVPGPNPRAHDDASAAVDVGLLAERDPDELFRIVARRDESPELDVEVARLGHEEIEGDASGDVRDAEGFGSRFRYLLRHGFGRNEIGRDWRIRVRSVSEIERRPIKFVDFQRFLAGPAEIAGDAFRETVDDREVGIPRLRFRETVFMLAGHAGSVA